MKEAEMPVEEIMTKVREGVQIDTPLVEAIRIKFKEDLQVVPVYKEDKLVGVLRDVELFLALAEVFGMDMEHR
jgi:predicted transcriptional regulator